MSGLRKNKEVNRDQAQMFDGHMKPHEHEPHPMDDLPTSMEDFHGPAPGGVAEHDLTPEPPKIAVIELTSDPEHLVQKIVRDVLAGTGDVLESYGALQRIKKLCAEAEKEIKDLAIMEAEKYEEKAFSYHGCDFQRKDGQARWTYPKTQELKDAEDTVKKLKARYVAAAEAQKRGEETLVGPGGEVTPVAVKVYSAPSLSFQGETKRE